MKKRLIIKDFTKAGELEDLKPTMIAFRRKVEGKDAVHFQNVEFDGNFKLDFDPETDEVVIRFPLRKTEFLAIADDKNKAEQFTI